MRERQLNHAVSETNRLKELCESQDLLKNVTSDKNKHNNKMTTTTTIKIATKTSQLWTTTRFAYLRLSKSIKSNPESLKGTKTHACFLSRRTTASPWWKISLLCMFINKWLLHQLRQSSIPNLTSQDSSGATASNR